MFQIVFIVQCQCYDAAKSHCILQNIEKSHAKLKDILGHFQHFLKCQIFTGICWLWWPCIFSLSVF